MIKPECEQWREIQGYAAYMASSLGRIKAKARLSKHRAGGTRKVQECIMKLNIDRGGYNSVVVVKNGKPGSAWVHRLVAIAFHGTPEQGKIVNHIDGNKLNNRPENLEWCTPSENSKHNYKIGLQKPQKTGLGKTGRLHHASKAVIQKCHDVVIARFESAGCAAKATGIPQGSISRVCRGERKQACGYVFEYTDQDLLTSNNNRFKEQYERRAVKTVL